MFRQLKKRYATNPQNLLSLGGPPIICPHNHRGRDGGTQDPVSAAEIPEMGGAQANAAEWS
jgi:hypothetical protein